MMVSGSLRLIWKRQNFTEVKKNDRLKAMPVLWRQSYVRHKRTAYWAICVQCGARCELTYIPGKKGMDIIAGVIAAAVLCGVALGWVYKDE